MINFILTGIILGLAAGVAPGPLLTLVISETLQHNTRAGIRVALAPVITDLPIIVLCVFVLNKLADFNTIIALISFIGGIVVMIMGLQGLRTKGADVTFEKIRPRSLAKGVVVNFFSPHPYLFWLSVGSPLMMKAADKSIMTAAVFVTVFYLFLVGSKLLLALLAGRSRAFLSGRTYLATMKVLGLILVFFSFYLFREGWLLYTG